MRAPSSTDDPSAFFYGVAVNLLKEHWRKTANREALPTDQTETWNSSGDPEEIREQAETRHEQEIRLTCLRGCLAELPPENLSLIKQYYSEGDVLNKSNESKLPGD